MDLLNLLEFAHVSFIHFPLATFVIGCILLYFLLLAKIVVKFTPLNIDKLVMDRIELISWFNFVIGWISFPFVAMLGLLDAGSIENVVLTDLLGFKMQLSFLVYFIFISPLYLKIFLYYKFNKQNIHINLTTFIPYTIMVTLGTFLTLIIAGAGGRYVFGHSLFDNFGLEFLIPQSFDYTIYREFFNISLIAEIVVSTFGIVFMLSSFIAMLIIPIKSNLIKLN